MACSVNIVAAQCDPAELFSPRSMYPTGDYPNTLAIADLNSDGLMDVVTSNAFSNDMSVLLGDTNDGFLPPVSWGQEGRAQGVSIGDFNNDGIPDLACAYEFRNAVGVLLGEGMHDRDEL